MDLYEPLQSCHLDSLKQALLSHAKKSTLTGAFYCTPGWDNRWGWSFCLVLPGQVTRQVVVTPVGAQFKVRAGEADAFLQPWNHPDWTVPAVYVPVTNEQSLAQAIWDFLTHQVDEFQWQGGRHGR